MENTFATIGNVAGSTVRVTVGDTSQALTDMIDTAMGSESIYLPAPGK